MAFITPRSAGPQRDLAYLDRYMGATGQLVNTRMGAADQQLNIGQMAQQDRQFGESRRDRALAGLAQSLQFANQLHMDQKRLSRQSQQMRQNAVFGGINAGLNAAGTAFGRGGIFAPGGTFGGDSEPMIDIAPSAKMAQAGGNVATNTVAPAPPPVLDINDPYSFRLKYGG
jgi:hypothetical protein